MKRMCLTVTVGFCAYLAGGFFWVTAEAEPGGSLEQIDLAGDCFVAKLAQGVPEGQCLEEGLASLETLGLDLTLEGVRPSLGTPDFDPFSDTGAALLPSSSRNCVCLAFGDDLVTCLIESCT